MTIAGILPPIPGPEGLHPIVVHFPIALLLVAPLFVLLWLLRRPGMGAAALLVMLLGTGSLLAAMATGEEAEDRAEAVAAAKATLESHEELAETTRNVFAGLTIAFALLLAAPKLIRRELPRAVGALFLLAYVGCLLLVVKTGHEGGRLVHEFGVRADFSASSKDQ